ncbi:hypothetical protein ACS0TY_024851 [Phlomoides rotata]
MRMMIIWIFSPKAAAVSPSPPPMSLMVNSLNLSVVQQRRLLWQMEVDSYGRLVRETGRLSCNL